MASRWRHWDAGCHDNIQTLPKFHTIQISGHSDEEFIATPPKGAGRGRKRPPVVSIRLPKDLNYPETRGKVEDKVAHLHCIPQLWLTQERSNYPSCSVSPNCSLARQIQADWRIQETKKLLCKVGVGRGRGRSKAEVLNKAPGRDTDNGYTFSGSAGDFRGYVKESSLKQPPSQESGKKDNSQQQEPETEDKPEGTGGFGSSRRLWTPDPKQRWRRDKIVETEDVEEWPHLATNSNPSSRKRSPRKRGKRPSKTSHSSVAPDVRCSQKTDDQKSLEKERSHSRQSKGKIQEMKSMEPDMSTARFMGDLLGASDLIRLDNLPPNVQTQEVCGILEPFGAILECRVLCYRDHSSALVRLADSDVCEWCVSCLNETESPFPGWQGPLFCSHVEKGDPEVVQ